MLQLRFPFASTPLIRNTSSSPTPKGENHHEWRRRPKEEWESFPTPLATSKRLSKHPKAFLYCANWGMIQTLTRNKIKNPYFDMSGSHRSALWRSALVRHRSALGNLTALCIWSTRHDFSGAWCVYLLQNQSFLVQSCSLEFWFVFFHHKCFLLTYLTDLKEILEVKQA